MSSITCPDAAPPPPPSSTWELNDQGELLVAPIIHVVDAILRLDLDQVHLFY